MPSLCSSILLLFLPLASTALVTSSTSTSSGTSTSTSSSWTTSSSRYPHGYPRFGLAFCSTSSSSSLRLCSSREGIPWKNYSLSRRGQTAYAGVATDFDSSITCGNNSYSCCSWTSSSFASSSPISTTRRTISSTSLLLSPLSDDGDSLEEDPTGDKDDDDLDLLMDLDDDDEAIDGNDAQQAATASTLGQNRVGGTSTGQTLSTAAAGNAKVPLQTDGGVIMPEGGANPCVIKVLGIGGGGGNAVNRMIQTRIDGVSFWAVNTDAQALAKSLAPNVLNIGRHVTRGLGAGGVPEVGKKSAQENARELQQICRGADMVFITAGMGGGTGSGAGPIVAEIARDEGCLTVGVVTKPFAFEGKKRMKQAEEAIKELRKHVDTLIVVSNDKLLRIVPENTPVTDAFLVADDILRQGVVGISEIIIKTGLVNVDFADVRAVMKDAGTALMGVGTGVGKTRATDAAVAAISSPLLDFPISEAKRIVFNVVGGSGLGLSEINAASEVIYENAHEDANIIFGALIDPDMGEEVSITVLACDFRENSAEGEPVKVDATAQVMAGRNGDGEYRSADFYKERRQMTRSPLGPNATVEETRTAITRGFKKPEPEPEPERKSFGKRMGGFFKRITRRSE